MTSLSALGTRQLWPLLPHHWRDEMKKVLEKGSRLFHIRCHPYFWTIGLVGVCPFTSKFQNWFAFSSNIITSSLTSMAHNIWSVFSLSRDDKETWQWNVLQGFVSLWKRPPTTWLRKIFDILPKELSLFQPNWLKLSREKAQFNGKNAKNSRIILITNVFTTKENIRKVSTLHFGVFFPMICVSVMLESIGTLIHYFLIARTLSTPDPDSSNV